MRGRKKKPAVTEVTTGKRPYHRRVKSGLEAELEALQQINVALKPLDPASQQRVLTYLVAH